MTTPEPRSEAWVATAPAEDAAALGEVSDASDSSDDGEDAPMSVAEARKLRREAQGLRTRLHEAEELIGAAAARETEHQRAEVERIASQHLIEAQDIWRAQPDIEAFVDEEFRSIVGDRVVETAKALAAEKPHLARPNTAPPPTDRPLESLRAGASPELKPKPITWAGALHGR